MPGAGADNAVLRTFLECISPIRDRIDRLVLFGSRARGDDRPGSDYDILVVVREKSPSILEALYEATMQVLFRTERLMSLKVYRKTDYERWAAIPTPFLRNVLREGVPFG